MIKWEYCDLVHRSVLVRKIRGSQSIPKVEDKDRVEGLVRFVNGRAIDVATSSHRISGTQCGVKGVLGIWVTLTRPNERKVAWRGTSANQ